jgi:hypothetical protein
MRFRLLQVVAVFAGFRLLTASAASLYVDINSTNPLPPYTDLSTAATNIQDAVDAADPGDLVLVSNGVYATGGRFLPVGAMTAATTNRLAILKAITVKGMNGPQFTSIQGYQMPGTTNGSDAIRGVFLTNGAVLDGFTITNGATQVVDGGGGVFCQSTNATVTNCVLVGNAATLGGGAWSGLFQNCTIRSNSAIGQNGGGSYGSLLVDCSLAGNWTSASGGGACNSVLIGCSVMSNRAQLGGGGVAFSTIMSSNLKGNSVTSGSGGGAIQADLSNCLLNQNSASSSGGGAFASTLQNCVLLANSARGGGGAMNSIIVNCLVVSNSSIAGNPGGGTFGCNVTNSTIVRNVADSAAGSSFDYLENSIIYLNSALFGSTNYSQRSAGDINSCCTLPLPTGGSGNITNVPSFVDQRRDYHLQPDSPCINSGNNASVASTTDLDGNSRISGGTVDIGAYEFQNPSSVISYAWLQQFGLPTDGSADFMDPDGDGMNNWQEWRAGTDPTNSQSVLKMLGVSNSPAGTTVAWQSSPGFLYYLQATTNPGVQPFTSIRSNLYVTTTATNYFDASATNGGSVFYRVGVQ